MSLLFVTAVFVVREINFDTAIQPRWGIASTQIQLFLTACNRPNGKIRILECLQLHYSNPEVSIFPKGAYLPFI